MTRPSVPFRRLLRPLSLHLVLLGLPMLPMALAPARAADEVALRELVECTPRNGLPNAFAKLEKGEPVTIAYLGGSITAQNGYRVLSEKWLQEKYPQAKVKGVHAAIGGTGSTLGVYRLDHDVLAFKPDLLFVEFAVNDGGTAPEEITRAMEGIVRQTWAALPNCDIVFVYTVTAKDLNTLHQGKMKRSASTMEAVADHYGIPSIHMGVEVARLEKDGKLVMKAEKGDMTRVSGDELNESAGTPVNADGVIPFAKDGVHPYEDTGHKLYMDAIARSVPVIKTASGAPAPHTLPAPMAANNYENARIEPLKPSMFTGPAAEMPKGDSLARRFNERMPAVWKAEPGAVLSFQFKGSDVMIYDLLGPDCGSVEVTLDGKTKTLKRVDKYCTYNRLSQLAVGSKLDPNQVHTVTVKVLDTPIDKRSILFENKRKEYDENPKKYEPLNWYPGGIMLVGELVESKS